MCKVGYFGHGVSCGIHGLGWCVSCLFVCLVVCLLLSYLGFLSLSLFSFSIPKYVCFSAFANDSPIFCYTRSSANSTLSQSHIWSLFPRMMKRMLREETSRFFLLVLTSFS
jgi:hypothetical protein